MSVTYKIQMSLTLSCPFHTIHGNNIWNKWNWRQYHSLHLIVIHYYMHIDVSLLVYYFSLLVTMEHLEPNWFWWLYQIIQIKDSYGGQHGIIMMKGEWWNIVWEQIRKNPWWHILQISDQVFTVLVNTRI